MRVSPKRFRNWEEMSTHLDKYREAPINQYWRPLIRIKLGRLHRLFEYLDDRLHLVYMNLRDFDVTNRNQKAMRVTLSQGSKKTLILIRQILGRFY